MAIKLVFDVEDKASRKMKSISDLSKRELKQLRSETDKASKEMQTSWEKVNGRLSKLSPTMKAVGIAAAAMAAATVYAVGKMGSSAIRAASDYEEMHSKFKVVFRGVEDRAKKTTDKLTESFGFSKLSVETWMASIQDTLVPMGLARDSAADLSGEVVQLAVDMGSFNNMPTETVMRDIQSALVGNHEAVRKYGSSITEARLKQEAINEGFEKSVQELTSQEKLMLRYKILVKDTADAQGDFARTQGSYANQTRLLREQITELQTGVGQELMPAMSKLVGVTKDLIEQFDVWRENNEGVIAKAFLDSLLIATAAVQTIVGGFREWYLVLSGPVAEALDVVWKAVTFQWDDLKQEQLEAKLAWYEYVAAHEEGSSTIIDALAAIREGLEKARQNVEEVEIGTNGVATNTGKIVTYTSKLDKDSKSIAASVRSTSKEYKNLETRTVRVSRNVNYTRLEGEKALDAFTGINASTHTFVGKLQTAVRTARDLYNTLSAIRSIFGFLGFLFHTGGVIDSRIPAGGYAPAGAPKYQTGGMVGLGPDERLIKVEVGEAVLNRFATAMLGSHGVAALNAGQIPGQQIINHYHITGNVLTEDFVLEHIIPIQNKAARDLGREVWSTDTRRAQRVGL